MTLRFRPHVRPVQDLEPGRISYAEGYLDVLRHIRLALWVLVGLVAVGLGLSMARGWW